MHTKVFKLGAIGSIDALVTKVMKFTNMRMLCQGGFEFFT